MYLLPTICFVFGRFGENDTVVILLITPLEQLNENKDNLINMKLYKMCHVFASAN